MLKIVITMWNKITIWKHRRYVLSQVKSGMCLGKNVMICPGVKFDPPHSFLTSIGDNCTIAPDVRFLNHDASLFGFVNFARIGKITIKDNCFIGAGATLLPGITIGPNSIVGACSVVTRNVEADCIVAGNPAREIKKTSDYIKHSKKNLDDNNSRTFQSKDFYSKISDQHFRREVIEILTDNIGFTVGSDNDNKFVFNIV